MTRHVKRAAGGAAIVAVVVATTTMLGGGGPAYGGQTARARLVDANGSNVGDVRLKAHRATMRVEAQVQLAPQLAGFHGFHIHAVGQCDPASNFISAGGHLSQPGQHHRDHAGDMPSLLVNADGRAEISFNTDRVTLSALFDSDGSAVVIHAGPDNFANIPARYAQQSGLTGPDGTTLATGDAGARVACGVLR